MMMKKMENVILRNLFSGPDLYWTGYTITCCFYRLNPRSYSWVREEKKEREKKRLLLDKPFMMNLLSQTPNKSPAVKMISYDSSKE